MIKSTLQLQVQYCNEYKKFNKTIYILVMGYGIRGPDIGLYWFYFR